MKKWVVLNKLKIKNSNPIKSDSKLKIDDVINLLLKNRGINTSQEIEEFLNPQLENVTVDSVGIDKKQLKTALKRISEAIQKKEMIIVFGDYDVDGICGSAILWETLRDVGANSMPYIPHRMDEGYGLSLKGIDTVLEKYPDTKIIITVDNGIVANEAVDYAISKGLEVIITDHHVPPAGGHAEEAKSAPKALAIVHTTKLCGTGVAWMLAQELKAKSEKRKVKSLEDNHLELVALATIADCVPLTGANRTLTKYGLELLKKTQRNGLLALCKEAGIEPSQIDVYRVGHVICPRLNAMGRLEYAMDSLRLICTKDVSKAQVLADKLGSTNKERQGLTQETVLHALSSVRRRTEIGKLLFVADSTYQQGVIGLVAGKLVEEFYRPSIVLSIGDEYSKASARSISGFNIIEFIRSASSHLVNAGGHPMAAGFTVETSKLTILQEFLETKAKTALTDDDLIRNLKIDCELPLSEVTFNLFNSIQQLSPFGMGNSEPTFASSEVVIEDMRLVGADRKHLKLKCSSENCQALDAIAFGMGERIKELEVGKKVSVAYTIAEDTWGNNRKLQIKVKDIKAN